MKINVSPGKLDPNLGQTDFLTTRNQDRELLLDYIADWITPVGDPIPTFRTPGSELIFGKFLFLVGQALPIDDYPELDDIYGPVFGRNLTLRTFSTPDLRGKYLFGTDTSGTGSTLGGTFGTKGQAHFHGMGTGADLNITSSGSHEHGALSPFTGNEFFTVRRPFGGGTYGITEIPGVNYSQTAYTPSGQGTHTHPSSSVSGRIGQVTGGQDGNSSLHPPSISVNWYTRFR